jgi:outer membrane protein assembly factor BamB
MKFKTTLVCLLITFSFKTFAQNSTIKVIENQNIFGKNIKNQSVILGTEYIFPDFIFNTYFQENEKNVILELRPTTKNRKAFKSNGTIVKYNLENKKIDWSKKASFNLNQIQYGDNEVMLKDIRYNSSTYLDPKNGNELWKKTMLFQYFNSEKKIGIGYKHNFMLGQNRDLQGINLENGDILWERNLNPKSNWEHVYYQNDSILIVQNAGLHTLNINTGKGWDYEATVEKKRPLAIFPYSNLQSNIIDDSLFYYHASLNKLVKINQENGFIEWEKDLPQETSTSTLRLHDNNITLLNLGTAVVGHKNEKFGKPFLKAFDAKTGEKLFFNPLETLNSPIIGYKFVANNLFLLLNDRIQKYDLKTGELVLEKEFNTEENGTLKYFINKIAGVVDTDFKFKSFDTASNQLYVYTNKAKTLALNLDLEVLKEIDVKDLYIINSYETSDYSVLMNSGELYIKDKDDNVKFELKNITNTYIINNILYSAVNNKLIIIDLNQI